MAGPASSIGEASSFQGETTGPKSTKIAAEPLGSSKMDISLNTRIVVSPEVLMQEISGESVLLDLKSESYFGLDEVGTRIWRLVERDGHLKAVHSALQAEYDVDAARLEYDLKELMGRLVDAGLVAVQTANEQEA